MVLAYSSYSKLIMMSLLRFEIFWRETANWQEENRQVRSGKIHNCAESSGITACNVSLGGGGGGRAHLPSGNAWPLCTQWSFFS